MRLQYWIPVIVFFLLIPAATAFINEDITITPAPWAVAGGPSVPIYIHVKNATLGAEVDKANVTLTVLNSTLGTIDQGKKYPVNGNVTFYFTPNRTKGDAYTNVQVFYNESFQFDTVTIIHIDHAAPKYYLEPICPSPSSVDDEIRLMVRLRDKFGNILDNKYLLEQYSIKFDVSGSDGYFDSGQKSTTVTSMVNGTNNNEESIVMYHTPVKAGNNYILIRELDNPFVYPNSTFCVINGIGTIPDHINVTIQDNDPNTPDPLVTYADPKHHFEITYTVRDKYENPVADAKIIWSINGKEGQVFYTNDDGQIFLKYSEELPQNVTITATVEFTEIPPHVRTLQFIQAEALDFLLTAVPQSLPSRDVPGKANETAIVTAKVIDYFGQPKANEKVTFIIDYLTLENSTVLTTLPAFLDVSINKEVAMMEVYTDTEGKANVPFVAGAFPTNVSDPLYNLTAIGTVWITASWADKPDKYILMTYKNYPFVQTFTSVETEYCVVNQTILNYSLSLVGNGYVFTNPVDIVLLEDRSGTMLLEQVNSAQAQDDRMWAAQEASMAFIGEMREGMDRVAILSYGDLALPVANLSNFTGQDGSKMWGQKRDIGFDSKTWDDDDFLQKNYSPGNYPGNGIVSYDDFSTVEYPFTGEFSELNDTIMEITPIDSYNDLRHDASLYSPMCVNDTNPANGLRYGIYEAITYLRHHNNTRAKYRVVVGLMDTAWTWFGDPIASTSLMQRPCGANAGTGPYWPFEDPDTGSYSAMADYHNASQYNFTSPHWSYFPGNDNWQNMSNYAKDNGIILFMVRYSAQEDKETFRTLETLCNPTGGAAYWAETPEQLLDAFLNISKRIHEIASVNTSVNVDFETISVDYEDLGGPITYAGDKVLNYTYIDGKSTYIQFENKSTNWSYTQDDTVNWTINRSFNWNIGSIKLDDMWTFKFSMIAKIPGNINLFGPNSTIMADNPDDDLPPQIIELPDTWMSCYMNWTPLRPKQETINVQFTNATKYNNTTGFYDVFWNLDYSYSGMNRTVQQELFYQNSRFPDVWTNDWIQFDVLESNASGLYNTTLDAQNTLGYIQLLVIAKEKVPGGADDQDTLIISNPKLCEQCILIE